MKATTKKVIQTAVLGAMFGLSACAPHNEAAENYYAADVASQGIVGGEKVAADDAISKSTVGIGAVLQGVICTGTLISKNLVVTAAHCTSTVSDPRRLVITFGNDISAKTLQVRKVLGGRVPAKWASLKVDQDKDWNDIAVLRIDGEAPEGFAPAVLLANKAVLKDDLDVTIAGFGMTSMKPAKYSDLLLKAGVKMTNATFADTEILFEQTKDGKGACHGDSGGPAYITVKGRAVLIGVTSRSATEAGGMNCLEGSIYTSIAGHIAFLRQAAKELTAKSFVPGEKIAQPSGI